MFDTLLILCIERIKRIESIKQLKSMWYDESLYLFATYYVFAVSGAYVPRNARISRVESYNGRAHSLHPTRTENNRETYGRTLLTMPLEIGEACCT